MRYSLVTFPVLACLFAAPATPATTGAVNITIPDTVLVDQNGQNVRLYTDLVKGRKVVVINTIFTTCKTICPQIGFRLVRLQKALDGFTARDYSLISISVDPQVDTPERLREWAGRIGVRPGWTLLTGPKMQVDAALRKLTLATPDKLTHSPLALVGSDGPDGFITCNALAAGDPLIALVKHKLAATKN